MTYTFTFEDTDLVVGNQPTAENLPTFSIQNIFAESPDDMYLEEYVIALYWFVLRRIPEDQEVNEWCKRIQNGMSCHDTIISFLKSEEAKRLAPHIQYTV